MVKKTINKSLVIVLAIALLIPSIASASKSFPTDVTVKHWAYNTIKYFLDQEIVSGYPDGTFKPERNVSHGEGLKITALAGNMKITDKSNNYKIRNINPVDQAGHWAEKYIEAAHNNGMMADLKNGLQYDKILTRHEALRYMVLYLDYTNPNVNVPLDIFIGEKEGSTFADAYGEGLEFLYREGLITGYHFNGEVYLRGDNKITRAEFLTLLKRIINYTTTPEPITKEPPKIKEPFVCTENYTGTDFEYDPITGTITGYNFIRSDLTKPKDVIIPCKINGVLITAIGEAAFMYQPLNSVSIPGSIISIGDRAFQFNNLTSVEMPDSVTTIGEWAFRIQNYNSAVLDITHTQPEGPWTGTWVLTGTVWELQQ